MILAGCDCRDASIKKYGYNISLVVRKKSIKVLDKIAYDPGDIKILKEYFPAQLNYYDEFLGRDILFDGNFSELNWK